MNIFATDLDPVQSALWLDDKRGRKMILESAQILAAVLHDYDIWVGYKKTHERHPVTIWAGKSYENYMWLVTHATALADAHRAYAPKYHKAFRVVKLAWTYRNRLPKIGLTPFANATIHFKHLKPTISAYKYQMIQKWEEDLTDHREHLHPTWKLREKPYWYNPESILVMLDEFKVHTTMATIRK